jgi:hypothetical protein
MAFVRHWELLITAKDRGGNSTNRTYVFADETDPPDDTAVAAFIVVWELTSLLKVSKFEVSAVQVNDAFTLPTDAGAEVEAHALITAPIHGEPTESATIDIPAPVPGLFVASSGKGYNVIDPGDTQVQNFLAYFTNGDTAQLFTISDGETIDQVNVFGKRTHSHSVRG